VPEKKKEGIARVLQVQDAFAARDQTRERKEEGKKRKDREWAARHYGLTRIVVVRSITGSRRAPPPARVVVVVFEPCMLTMVTEGGMGLRELAMPVDKVGAADSLTRAVTIMVIIIVERIKRSRREEVDGGQLERAVEKGRLC
jgi:hypothetical protein